MSPALRCLHVFSTFDPGGPQVRTARLAQGLGNEFVHTVIAMDGRTGATGFVPAGTRLEVLPLPVPRGRLFAVRMARWLRRNPFDLLLTYNWGAIETVVAARLAGFGRVIHGEDGFNPDELDGQKRRRVLLRRALLPGTAAVVVPSRVLLAIARQTWRVPEDRLLHIDNGIELARFLPGDAPAARVALEIPPSAPVVGTVAHLRPVKNTARLLRAFAHAAPAQAWLLVVGDGPDRPALEQEAAALGIAARTVFTGVRPDPVACYQAMDVFALSSRSEQMPVAVVEAMAMARAVLATDVGDVRAMVAAPNRDFVVPEPDEAAYAAALGRLLGSPALVRELGAANRAEAAARFDQRQMLEKYRALYLRVARS
jgi:glycosyltransferase involved in cell wall biosynthesis